MQERIEKLEERIGVLESFVCGQNGILARLDKLEAIQAEQQVEFEQLKKHCEWQHEP